LGRRNGRNITVKVPRTTTPRDIRRGILGRENRGRERERRYANIAGA
jgi:hypothetical protein